MNKHGKSTLFTPDPYHTPGYLGYCPQFKYEIGETFGRTTSQLLRNTDVAYSGQPVLGNIIPGTPYEKQIEQKKNYIAERGFNKGDQKLCEQMVPGYTGYIPKGEHHFGKRYAESTLNAVVDFEKDQQNLKKVILKPEKYTLTGDPVKYNTPLKPIRSRPKLYISPLAVQHSLSPFTISNQDPVKFLMSGYTGFVPRARGYNGMGHPRITNKALIEFSDESRRLRQLIGQPIKVDRQEKKVVDTKPIYIKDMGMVPRYTGHVPGEKFRYGGTFGYSTKNAYPQS